MACEARKNSVRRRVRVTRSLGFIPKDVAPTPDRVDQPGSVSFELLAKFHHMHLERIRKPIVTLVPYLLVNPRSREHFVRVPQEKNEQGFFLGGQIEPLPTALDSVGDEVEAKIAVRQDVPSARAWATGQSPNARQQLLEGER